MRLVWLEYQIFTPTTRRTTKQSLGEGGVGAERKGKFARRVREIIARKDKDDKERISCFRAQRKMESYRVVELLGYRLGGSWRRWLVLVLYVVRRLTGLWLG